MLARLPDEYNYCYILSDIHSHSGTVNTCLHMSQKPSRLSVPARKLYIGQLLKCSRSENEDLDSNQGNWKYMTSELSLVFNQVWIQGVVISATKDRSDVIVDDGTGIVLLTGINRIIKDVKFCEGNP